VTHPAAPQLGIDGQTAVSKVGQRADNAIGKPPRVNDEDELIGALRDGCRRFEHAPPRHVGSLWCTTTCW
jgi:hypothetical protein